MPTKPKATKANAPNSAKSVDSNKKLTVSKAGQKPESEGNPPVKTANPAKPKSELLTSPELKSSSSSKEACVKNTTQAMAKSGDKTQLSAAQHT